MSKYTPKHSDEAKQHAIFVAGQLMGAAMQLNVPALEEFLDYEATDEFRYHSLCRAAIKFRLEADKSLQEGN